jgi:hypothetical protein
MRKLILIIGLLIPFVLSAQTNLTYTTAQVQTILDNVALIEAKQPYSYVIEKVVSTYYARPSGSLTAYSGSTASSVIKQASDQLTTGGIIFLNTKGVVWDNCDSIRLTNPNVTLEGPSRFTYLQITLPSKILELIATVLINQKLTTEQQKQQW